MTISGLVFDLARFSLHDGPGIRSVVFLKGCPLRCVWCHNPESWSARPEIMVSPEKCIGCGACLRNCPEKAHTFEQGKHQFKRDLCTACGKCAEECFSGTLVLAGKRRTVSDILAEAAKDSDYYGNDGGLTVSGGEPLQQSDFTEALLKGAKMRSWTTAIETCGMAPPHVLERLIPITDYWLFDIKAMDPEKHRKFTGQTNEQILSNLHLLDERGANIELRCPLIPGANDSDADLKAIRDLADSLRHRPKIHIEPFHPFGRGKLAQLGLPQEENAPIPGEQEIKRWRQALLPDPPDKKTVHLK